MKPHLTNTHSTDQLAGYVRIIGGQGRGRKLPVLDQPGLRPTSDRVRETLFNWLQFEIAGKDCLDLFSGSGALGFEALSREAASVTLLEKNALVAKGLQQTLQAWQTAGLASPASKVVNTDSLTWLASASAQENKPCPGYDLIFIDPPFGQKILTQTLDILCNSKLTHPQTWLYLEQEKGQTWPLLPEGWFCYREKSTSQVMFSLWRQEQ